MELKHKRILAISNNFPTIKHPQRGIFVKNILDEIEKQGVSVDTIAPVSIFNEMFKAGLNESIAIELSKIKYPKHIAVPFSLPISTKKLYKINRYLYKKSILNSIEDLNYDFVYAHFFQSIDPCIEFFNEKKIPIILNIGESSLWEYDKYFNFDWSERLETIAAIVCVSRMNYEYLAQRNKELISKLHYIPNGVDIQKFRNLPKNDCRIKLGLPQKDRIALFIGSFIERKGIDKVYEAVRRNGIKGVFLGSGPLKPAGDHVLFAGPVKHKDMPFWLNASDVFVLPSKAEGLSNAILEAIGTETPSVITDAPFNTDVFPLEMVEYVDHNSIESISKGIANTEREIRRMEMINAMKSNRESYSLSVRIKKIFQVAQKLL